MKINIEASLSLTYCMVGKITSFHIKKKDFFHKPYVQILNIINSHEFAIFELSVFLTPYSSWHIFLVISQLNVYFSCVIF